ncbi:phytanoyl-CoA dioxygenase family protein [Flavobacterium sp. N502536]|uniref:phytanoyl-CoA dioxygenase family protein n=1 Tax=Flavobacterium sp. N502536 TaxID=2986837 RepID=UPI0022225A20|nr:phytanoyl-CoA dioxygenase family protein [Flavobacterium sp. N502536]
MKEYEQTGYACLENFFSEKELLAIEKILIQFHERWLFDHVADYEKGILNSHSLTSGKYLNEEEKAALFEFISQDKLAELLKAIFPKTPIFLNTQLFFDPKNADQKNYWHRDIQYTGMTVDDQKKAIQTQNVVHFRIPMKSEPGSN